MFYSVCLYLLACFGVWFTNNKRLDAIRKANGRFEESVDAYILFVYLVPLAYLPFTYWREASKAAVYMNKWIQFEVRPLCREMFDIEKKVKVFVIVTQYLLKRLSKESACIRTGCIVSDNFRSRQHFDFSSLLQRKQSLLLDCLTLKIKTLRSFEASVIM
jgi:hypothetical protein